MQNQARNKLRHRLPPLGDGMPAKAQDGEAERLEVKRLRCLLDLSSEALFLLEPGSGNLVEANATLSRMLGLKREELLARRGEDLLEARVAERIRVLAMEGGIFLQQKLITSLHGRDRRKVPVELSLACAHLDGRPHAVVAARDITEPLQTRTQELNRIMEELLGPLSHELRTPLTAILGWAQLLQSKRLEPEEQPRVVEGITRNALAQAQLIDQLLDVSACSAGKLRLKPVTSDLTAMVQTAAEPLRFAAEAKRIRLELPGEPGPLVLGDPGRLQQIVFHLLSNAIKFTPCGGLVQVRLERGAGQAHLVVRDTGKGFAPDFEPLLFQSFRMEDATPTRPEAGLGVGLSIVRHLVELHGGTVTAVSPGPGQGAEFRVCLPLAV